MEFLNKKVKIFDVDEKLIGIGEKTRFNLFKIDPTIIPCLFYKVKMYGCVIRYFVI